MKTWKHLNIEQRKADVNLINSRRGIDLDDEEFNKLDFIIKKALMKISLFFKLK